MTILKADPEYRRKFLLLYGLLAVIGLGVIRWVAPLLENWIMQKEPSEAIRFLQLLLVLLFLPLLPIAYYPYYLARKVIASNQFPPPGMKVIRDTKILEGAAARRKGCQLFVVSILLGVIAFLGIVYLPYLVGQLSEIPKYASAS